MSNPAETLTSLLRPSSPQPVPSLSPMPQRRASTSSTGLELSRSLHTLRPERHSLAQISTADHRRLQKLEETYNISISGRFVYWEPENSKVGAGAHGQIVKCYRTPLTQFIQAVNAHERVNKSEPFSFTTYAKTHTPELLVRKIPILEEGLEEEEETGDSDLDPDGPTTDPKSILQKEIDEQLLEIMKLFGDHPFVVKVTFSLSPDSDFAMECGTPLPEKYEDIQFAPANIDGIMSIFTTLGEKNLTWTDIKLSNFVNIEDTYKAVDITATRITAQRQSFPFTGYTAAPEFFDNRVTSTSAIFCFASELMRVACAKAHDRPYLHIMHLASEYDGNPATEEGIMQLAMKMLPYIQKGSDIDKEATTQNLRQLLNQESLRRLGIADDLPEKELSVTLDRLADLLVSAQSLQPQNRPANFAEAFQKIEAYAASKKK